MSNRYYILLIVCCLLTACVKKQADFPSRRTSFLPFIAKGNTPEWQLKIDEKSIQLNRKYHLLKVKTPLPERELTLKGERYSAARLVVEITYTTCTDSMSGERFSETVRVVRNSKSFSGCGGMKLPVTSLNGTNWNIVSIDEQPVVSPLIGKVQFDYGRITGTAGCNRFSADFSESPEAITIRPMNLTKQICSPALNAHEKKVLSLLKGKLHLRYTDDGRLILANATGSNATLKKVL